MQSSECKETNFNKVKQYVDEIADSGAQMVCLPESFAYLSN